MIYNPPPSGSGTPFSTVTSSLSNGADYAVSGGGIFELGFTSAGWSAVLPSTAGLTTGLYGKLVNAGSYAFAIRDSNHKFLGVLQPSSGSATTRQQADLIVESTAAQTWRVANTSEFSPLSTFYSGQATVGNASSSNNPIVVNLTPTTFLVIYSRTTASIYGIVGTVSGNTITWGADTLIVTATHTAASKSATLLTSGLVLLSYAGASGFLNAIAVDIIAGAPSPNTNAILDAVTTVVGTGVCTLSSTVGAVIYQGTTVYSHVATLTVAGSNPTRTVALGTPTAALESVVNAVGVAIAPISSNSVLAVWATTTDIDSVVVSGLTSAGGTVNSIVQVAASQPNTEFSVAALSPTAFVVGYSLTNTAPAATLLTVSAQTITAQNTITLLGAASSTWAKSVVALSATKALYVGPDMFFLDLSGTTLSYEVVTTPTVSPTSGLPLFNPVASPLLTNASSQALCVMSANQVVGTFVDANPYVNALTVETPLP